MQEIATGTTAPGATSPMNDKADAAPTATDAAATQLENQKAQATRNPDGRAELTFDVRLDSVASEPGELRECEHDAHYADTADKPSDQRVRA